MAGQRLSLLAARIVLHSLPEWEEVQPGPLESTDHDPSTQAGSRIKTTYVEEWPWLDTASWSSPRGFGPLVPFLLPRPHQQKQSHSHQDGAATHSCQA